LSEVAGKRARPLAEWLERRVGWRKLMHESLDEPVPGGSRWAYVFGSGLLFVFISQIVTGICLSVYYVPSVDHAHTTVAFMQKVVWGGRFIRSLHAYGSSLMIILLVLHLTQTYVYGAYKSRRELLWLAGCLLLVLVLGMGFTGYLLPWDRRAYFATAVGTNIISEVPFVGPFLKIALRGGAEMGTLTLSRFFVLHVFLLPALIFGTVAVHLFLFRKAGAAGPPLRPEILGRLPVRPFFPDQVVKDFFFGIVLIAVLFGLSTLVPAKLGPVANPTDSTYVPRPEWYYLPAFQWLKYWRGHGVLIGIVLIPLALFAALFGIPFLDRSPERAPLRRPLAIGGFLLILGGFLFLGFRSGAEDRRDPAVRGKIVAQEEAETEYTKAPFEADEGPLALGAATAQAPRDLTPEAAKGALLFESEGCSACHGAGGGGGEGLVKLWGMKDRFEERQLADLLRHPRGAMLEGGMEPSKLPEPDLQSLIAYLRINMNARK